jgi:voltage-gated potassium channel
VPFFKPLSQKCKVALCKVLEPVVVGPNEYVIKEGDIGNEMYFIGHGFLEVLDSKRERIAELQEGSFFGEIALMEEVTRTASIKTMSYCNLYKLGKEDFLQIMHAFEELAVKIEEIKAQRKH